MEQNNMKNEILRQDQVYTIKHAFLQYVRKEIKELYPETNNFELDNFIWRLAGSQIEAVLCTLHNDAYENIIKLLREKVNINDLFENRQQYLN